MGFEIVPRGAPEAAAAGHSRITLGSINGDLAGGFAATLIAIPQAMSLGILAVAALGPSFASTGVLAALLASVVGSVVAALLPSVRCQIMGARASATAVVASLVSALTLQAAFQNAGATDVGAVLALVSVTIFLAGLLQIGFGAARLGRAIKYVPYPVIGGFMTGIALIILLSQVRPALGMAGVEPLSVTLRDLGSARPGSLVTAAVAFVAILVAPRLTRRVPALLCGLFAGISAHYAFVWAWPDSTGDVLGRLPELASWSGQWLPMIDFLGRDDALRWIEFVLPSAFLLALVAGLDGLLAAVLVDSITRGRHDGRRVLTGQGLASMALAGIGMVPAVNNSHTPIANFLAGGRTRLSSLFHALFMLLALFLLGPLVAAVPVAALAGLMIYIGLTLVDRWTRDLLVRLRRDDEHRLEILVNVGIVVVVAAAQVLLNVMVAVAIGVVAAVMLLIVKLSGSPIRRSLDGTQRASLKQRPSAAEDALAPLAGRIRILELQGELFFGTADRLQAEVEDLSAETEVAILDFRRVHQIDASGARVLELIAQRAARRGMRVLMSHLREDEPRGRYLRTLGLGAAVGPSHWFTDLDRALEWAEDHLLEKAGFVEGGGPHELRDMALFEGLEGAEVDSLTRRLEKRELCDGEVVFLEGDEGDRIYLIAEGAVSIKVKLDDPRRARRLATFCAGVMFGEMALLEGARRSADAYAKGDHVLLYSLSADALSGIVREDPELGLKIYRNISRHLASRLRSTTSALRALE